MFSVTQTALIVNPLSQECPLWIANIDLLPEVCPELGKCSLIISGLSNDAYFSEVIDRYDDLPEALEAYLDAAFEGTDEELLPLRVTIKGPFGRDWARGSYFREPNGPLVFAIRHSGKLHTYKRKNLPDGRYAVVAA